MHPPQLPMGEPPAGAGRLSQPNDGSGRLALKTSLLLILSNILMACMDLVEQQTWDCTGVRLLQNSGGLQIYVAGGEENPVFRDWRVGSVLADPYRHRFALIAAAVRPVLSATFWS